MVFGGGEIFFIEETNPLKKFSLVGGWGQRPQINPKL